MDGQEEREKRDINTNKQDGALAKGFKRSVVREVADTTRALGMVFLLLVSLSTGFLGGWLGAMSRSNTGQNSQTREQIVLKESEVISKIAKDVGPSVVSIDVTSKTTQSGDFFFGFDRPLTQQSAGTGFIVSVKNNNAIVVTNRHVVSGGDTSKITITLSDGSQLDSVQLIGKTAADDPLDIAFLKITDLKGHNLSAVKLGDSSKVNVGDRVVAIGNALGQFQNTVTSGIISGYGRNIQAGNGGGASENLQDLFQTDAAINQGNSGGPLVNINGEVIGINTAIAGGQAQNIGFAIPIDNVKGMIDSVIKTNKFERPYLGVRYLGLNKEIANTLNLKVDQGAYIAPSTADQPAILPNSPAAKAGLREKDIITKVDGVKIDQNHTLTSLVGRSSVGNSVSLTVIRDGKEITVTVVLGAAPTGQ